MFTRNTLPFSQVILKHSQANIDVETEPAPKGRLHTHWQRMSGITLLNLPLTPFQQTLLKTRVDS